MPLQVEGNPLVVVLIGVEEMRLLVFGQEDVWMLFDDIVNGRGATLGATDEKEIG